jgi:hypothetical protein
MTRKSSNNSRTTLVQAIARPTKRPPNKRKLTELFVRKLKPKPTAFDVDKCRRAVRPAPAHVRA